MIVTRTEVPVITVVGENSKLQGSAMVSALPNRGRKKKIIIGRKIAVGFLSSILDKKSQFKCNIGIR